MGTKFWLACGALLAGAGVALGAYHAHGLEKALSGAGLSGEDLVKRLDNFETAARYQMYHALGILLIGLLALSRPNRLLHAAGCCFLIGIVCFSGSLYISSAEVLKRYWYIVPGGGAAFIVGWLVLAAACILGRKSATGASIA